ncbi:alpha-1,4-glucan--maltose-1-phosphate maltosyltransferase [Geomesophilobacter sediminis]|uniref:Alpha-1,4-glucan:maltose-1-phosphate maltosyltransferase n=1 Tax=Geomesophilobacter sediminis TaxID=2798584 RepID=A0A8J7M331_9BACT|nr:alpha-1,4-glucan--maltose-1-phosphate maltosyltransferase [Geomesophilobacter sediminis]MBJ6727805.1 alpha-1,4-glucan--maltose-1-phosphate maltosyltransferase [Geomesophilobacter sediminis]
MKDDLGTARREEPRPCRQDSSLLSAQCIVPPSSGRVVIEAIWPQVGCGRFPVKRVAGEELTVQADVFCDGHDEVGALLLFRRRDSEQWQERLMRRQEDDRWEGNFSLPDTGAYIYTVAGWVNHYRTWQKSLQKKHQAGQDVRVEIAIGAKLIRSAAETALGDDAVRLHFLAQTLEQEHNRDRAVELGLDQEIARFIDEHSGRPFLVRYHQEFEVQVDRDKALFSSWYELFPRSCSADPGRHGTFTDVAKLLPDLAELGFDVLYLPPIHPIGTTKRKGKNNAVVAEPGDPGSPWAIGAPVGGHKAVHPELGTLDDFRDLVSQAQRHGIEIALDIAFQCSPDHPYLKSHPEWFLWRPDGTVQHAENPPKKYEDIIPFHFENPNWKELWEELKSVILFWVEQGVRIFRIDNPHTKPLPFWEWLLCEVKKSCPEVLFLSEAFTRHKVMYRLAKLGFSQSYTYFSWRNSKAELTAYVDELVHGEVREFLRPNFWPNTPDILPEPLQYGGRAAFMIRFILAATLSSSYGIYGPVFELCVGEAVEGSEEYLHAEKYEVRAWDRDAPGNIRRLVAQVNRIRRENEALQDTFNVRFHHCTDDNVVFFGKSSRDGSNVILIAVSLDPFRPHQTEVRVPIEDLGIPPGAPYPVHDLLSEEKFIWEGDWNRIELDPAALPARILKIRPRLRKEVDFDYYL